MFTFMLLMVLYIFSQFFAIFGLINLDIANIQLPIPITIFEVSLTTNRDINFSIIIRYLSMFSTNK